MHTGFWWGNLRERDHLEHLAVSGRIILSGTSRSEMGVWTGMICLRIGTSGGLL
jgi:hypothetical protein